MTFSCTCSSRPAARARGVITRSCAAKRTTRFDRERAAAGVPPTLRAFSAAFRPAMPSSTGANASKTATSSTSPPDAARAAPSALRSSVASLRASGLVDSRRTSASASSSAASASASASV